MTPANEKRRRIGEARSLVVSFWSLSDVRDPEIRQSLAHDQIVEMIRLVCAPRNGCAPFTAAQLDCIVQIGFHLAFTLDARNLPRRGLLPHLRQGWREARPIERVAIVVALAVGVPGMIVAAMDLYDVVSALLE